MLLPFHPIPTPDWMFSAVSLSPITDEDRERFDALRAAPAPKPNFDLPLRLVFLVLFSVYACILFLLAVLAVVYAAGAVIVAGLVAIGVAAVGLAVSCFQDAARAMTRVRL